MNHNGTGFTVASKWGHEAEAQELQKESNTVAITMFGERGDILKETLDLREWYSNKQTNKKQNGALVIHQKALISM